MRIATASSQLDDTTEAAREAAGEVSAQLDGRRPDLVLLFVSKQHLGDVEVVSSLVREALSPVALAGVSAESVVGCGEEQIDVPSIAVWAATLPGARVETAWLRHRRAPDGLVLDGLSALATLDEVDAGPRTLLLFADPFSFRADDLLGHLHEVDPDLAVAGGLSSSSQEPGSNRLFHGESCPDEGAVAVLITGGPRLVTVVSQGCRPFGKPLVVTRCHENFVDQLGGVSPFERFSEQAQTLDHRELGILAHGLHIGRAVDSGRASDGEGEYLVRNVLGFVEESGSMAIGDFPTLGQTVHFHLRDPESASGELEKLLQKAALRLGDRVRGALLFTCSGRGTRMFEEPHHDTGAIRRRFGNVPIAGFFAGGEIGPVGGENFLHGFTAVTVLFAEPA